jgi:type IV pilus modification protein PilV
MRRMTGFRETRARGFTLVETLVATVVLSVGLLGAVALLMGGMRDHAESRRESEAVGLLRDVADRLRANAAACAASMSGAPCETPSLVALELAHLERTAAALYPDGETTTSIEYAPATGAVPDRYVITLRLARDAAVNVMSLQVHAHMPVAG